MVVNGNSSVFTQSVSFINSNIFHIQRSLYFLFLANNDLVLFVFFPFSLSLFLMVLTGATEEALRSCHIYYTLTLILSGFVLLPTVFVIVVSIRLRERNKQKGMLTTLNTHLNTQ